MVSYHQLSSPLSPPNSSSHQFFITHHSLIPPPIPSFPQIRIGVATKTPSQPPTPAPLTVSPTAFFTPSTTPPVSSVGGAPSLPNLHHQPLIPYLLSFPPRSSYFLSSIPHFPCNPLSFSIVKLGGRHTCSVTLIVWFASCPCAFCSGERFGA